MTFDRTMTRIFQFLLVLFFSITAGSAVLGFLRIYSPVSMLIVTGALAAGLLFLLWRTPWQAKTDPSPQFPPWISAVLAACGCLILFALILYPVLHWPTSHAGDWFPWDAGLYHFPKALELYRSGSVWDLSIAYGDYPFGYESLLSFGLVLTHAVSSFGLIHALIVLFFVSGFWLLARRITQLDGGLLLLLIVLIILSDKLFQFMNLWRVFTQDIYTVGKNDVLVAAAVLSVLWYFYQVQDDYRENILGLSLASGLAASIKPNTLYVLFPLWLFLLIRNYRTYLASLLSHALLMVPGLLWLVRNLIVLGAFAGADAARLSSWSIAANLTNPYFYHNIPKNLLLITALVIVEIILSIKDKKGHFWNAVLAVVLWIAFISTPVTAYFENVNTVPEIKWRFGEALLAFMAVLVMNDGMLVCRRIKLKRTMPKLFLGLLVALTVMGSMLFIVSQREVMRTVPQNAIILHDQFWEPVGVDGYRSAYDYVQKNVHHSVVWVENGLPFYGYDAGFTNSISREGAPDYVVGFKKNWFGSGYQDFPDLIQEMLDDPAYSVVYEDGEGVVLKRK